MSEYRLRKDKFTITASVFCGICLVYLLFLSRGPTSYSFNELDRANAACNNSPDQKCQHAFLKIWRKANPDAPSGSKP